MGICLRHIVTLYGEDKKTRKVLELEGREVIEGKTKIIIMRWCRATTSHFVNWSYKRCKGTFKRLGALKKQM